MRALAALVEWWERRQVLRLQAFALTGLETSWWEPEARIRRRCREAIYGIRRYERGVRRGR